MATQAAAASRRMVRGGRSLDTYLLKVETPGFAQGLDVG